MPPKKRKFEDSSDTSDSDTDTDNNNKTRGPPPKKQKRDQNSSHYNLLEAQHCARYVQETPQTINNEEVDACDHPDFLWVLSGAGNNGKPRTRRGIKSFINKTKYNPKRFGVCLMDMDVSHLDEVEEPNIVNESEGKYKRLAKSLIAKNASLKKELTDSKILASSLMTKLFASRAQEEENIRQPIIRLVDIMKTEDKGKGKGMSRNKIVDDPPSDDVNNNTLTSNEEAATTSFHTIEQPSTSSSVQVPETELQQLTNTSEPSTNESSGAPVTVTPVTIEKEEEKKSLMPTQSSPPKSKSEEDDHTSLDSYNPDDDEILEDSISSDDADDQVSTADDRKKTSISIHPPDTLFSNADQTGTEVHILPPRTGSDAVLPETVLPDNESLSCLEVAEDLVKLTDDNRDQSSTQNTSPLYTDPVNAVLNSINPKLNFLETMESISKELDKLEAEQGDDSREGRKEDSTPNESSESLSLIATCRDSLIVSDDLDLLYQDAEDLINNDTDTHNSYHIAESIVTSLIDNIPTSTENVNSILSDIITVVVLSTVCVTDSKREDATSTVDPDSDDSFSLHLSDSEEISLEEPTSEIVLIDLEEDRNEPTSSDSLLDTIPKQKVSDTEKEDQLSKCTHKSKKKQGYLPGKDEGKKDKLPKATPAKPSQIVPSQSTKSTPEKSKNSSQTSSSQKNVKVRKLKNTSHKKERLILKMREEREKKKKEKEDKAKLQFDAVFSSTKKFSSWKIPKIPPASKTGSDRPKPSESRTLSQFDMFAPRRFPSPSGSGLMGPRPRPRSIGGIRPVSSQSPTPSGSGRQLPSGCGLIGSQTRFSGCSPITSGSQSISGRYNSISADPGQRKSSSKGSEGESKKKNSKDTERTAVDKSSKEKKKEKERKKEKKASKEDKEGKTTNKDLLGQMVLSGKCSFCGNCLPCNCKSWKTKYDD